MQRLTFVQKTNNQVDLVNLLKVSKGPLILVSESRDSKKADSLLVHTLLAPPTQKIFWPGDRFEKFFRLIRTIYFFGRSFEGTYFRTFVIHILGADSTL